MVLNAVLDSHPMKLIKKWCRTTGEPRFFRYIGWMTVLYYVYDYYIQWMAVCFIALLTGWKTIGDLCFLVTPTG